MIYKFTVIKSGKKVDKMVISPLLEKTRLINKILQNDTGKYVDFYEIAKVLRDVIEANVYIVSLDGAILGYGLVDEYECELMISQVLDKEYFPDRYNEFLLKSDELRDNLRQKKNNCVFTEETNCLYADKVATIIPVIGSGRRLGTLLLARFNNKEFMADDLILAEKGATVLGMEILREETDKLEEEARDKAIVKLAMHTLSYSEMESVEQVFKEISDDGGLLVASKIADNLGITRSVIVNALRKLESAGVIESRSLGMKGTHIRVLNPHLSSYLKQKASQ
jgi:transcriptional pleiotropic repressor